MKNKWKALDWVFKIAGFIYGTITTLEILRDKESMLYSIALFMISKTSLIIWIVLLVAYIVFRGLKWIYFDLPEKRKKEQVISSIEQFAKSFDGQQYKTKEAEIRYLALRQKHIEKSLKISADINIDSVAISFDNKEDTEFYNEYNRVNK